MQELIGPGALSQLEQVLESDQPLSVLLVHGQSFRGCGAATTVERALSGHRVCRFESPSADYLDMDVVDQCLQAGQFASVNIVLAVGGGRIIDLAKLAAFGLGEKNSIDTFLDSKVCGSAPLPLIAVPTTAGSGSQATHFAVVFRSRKKYSLAHRALLPQVAIVDPNLLESCPRRLLATSGLDALCQGIESYWSVQSTEESRTYALEAVALCLSSLEPAVLSKDEESLAQLSKAAHLAGKAINISFTTAAHACSYVLSSHHRIAHGHAVALMLVPLCHFNGQISEDPQSVNDPRGSHFVRERFAELLAQFDVESPQQLSEALKALINSLGLETSLDTLGVSLPELLGEAKELINEDRLGNNPRRLRWEHIKALYEEAS